MKKQLTALAMAGLLLAGCTGVDGKIYGQREVLAYVDDLCSEPYDLVGTELVAQLPDDMRYDFVTRERGLAFTAHSTLSQVVIDASPTVFYTKSITCNYVQAVHALYQDQVQAALARGRTWMPEYGWMYLVEFADLDDVVDTLLAADALYTPELAYNPPEFLQQNPVAGVHLVWQRSAAEAAEHKTWVNLGDVSLTGQHERQALYDRLAHRYAQLCVDSKITNAAGVPERYLAGKHVSRLDLIMLDGVPMAYDTADNPYNQFGLTTDDFAYSWYSDAVGDYMLAADAGYMTDRASYPLILREYVLALGGHYDRETDDRDSVSRWTIGPDSWELRTTMGEDGVTAYRVTKNGEPLDLTWYTVDQELNVGATFCVGLTVTDFCRLFDLNCTADEAAGALRFTRQSVGSSE